MRPTNSIIDQIDQFRREGGHSGAAHRAVKEALRDKLPDRNREDYHALWDEFRSATERAFPHDVKAMKRQIDAGNTPALDTAIAFLVADPWFFGSGYIKVSLIASVKRASLDDGQRAMLQGVVCSIIRERDGQEFRHCCRLACRVVTADFLARIAALTKDNNAQVRRRARWVQDALYRGPLSGYAQPRT